MTQLTTLIRTECELGVRLEHALAPENVVRVAEGRDVTLDRIRGLPGPADETGAEQLVLELLGDQPTTAPAVGIPEDDVWDRSHEVLDVAMAAAHRVGPRMLERGRGRVLFVLPAQIKEPRELPLVATAYGVGLQGLSKHLANEWGRGTGVNTLLWRTTPGDRVDERELASVVSTARFLLSDEAAHVNGSVLLADGGASRSIF